MTTTDKLRTDPSFYLSQLALTKTNFEKEALIGGTRIFLTHILQLGTRNSLKRTGSLNLRMPLRVSEVRVCRLIPSFMQTSTPCLPAIYHAR